MGLFESQVSERRKADQDALEKSFNKIAGAVIGQDLVNRLADSRIVTKHAIDEILKAYHYKSVAIPETMKTVEEQLSYSCRHYGIMRREIELKENWYKDSYGPILGFFKETGEPVALIQSPIFGYYYNDFKKGQKVIINKRTAKHIDKDAFCFYKPLPLKRLEIPDLLIYINQCIDKRDVFNVILALFIVTMIGILVPDIMAALTGPIARSGNTVTLISVAVTLVCISFSSMLFTSISNLLRKRIEIKAGLGVQSSMMMRLLSFPAKFYRQYSPGELYSRSTSMDTLCDTMVNILLNVGLASVMSLLFIFDITRFTPELCVPSILFIIITVAVSMLTTSTQVRVKRKYLECSARETGFSYSLITGIEKIKLAGAEKRMLAKWLDHQAEMAKLTYNPPMIIKMNKVVSTAITLLSNIVFYYLAAINGISQSSYFAFLSAYGMIMGAFMSLAGVALDIAQIQPALEMTRPFLNTLPETIENKEFVTKISGNIKIDHVSFRYSENGPYVLKDLSLNIHSGEYVAIVGKTGCGKTTIHRLLLGFETPEKGAVYYDDKDINSLDPVTLRQNIGSVTQDGRLFQGDIYSNIVISAPWLTIDDAWEAAEQAGIADDIRKMPLGMSTPISEGHGGISGGQRQRLMIARAIAPRPKLLIFDEATSALDNKTQKQVSDALDKMGCTRIIIAHRLSTIRHCDRILVMDGGEIVEEGSYEELINKNGYFANLVEKQRINAI